MCSCNHIERVAPNPIVTTKLSMTMVNWINKSDTAASVVYYTCLLVSDSSVNTIDDYSLGKLATLVPTNYYQEREGVLIETPS